MPSLVHRVLTFAIPRVRRSSEVGDAAQVRAEVRAAQAAARASDPTSSPPSRLVRGFELSRLDGFGFPVHDLRPTGAEPTRTVLYLHGGGYVGGIDRFHWRFVTRLARTTAARVVVPAYPLAPDHTWRDSRAALLALFEQLAVESPGGVALVGDSAGGGLALALGQQIAAGPGPQPTRLVLMAPWVDLTGSTPGTEELRAADPWLKLTKLRLYGGWWAGEDDPDRPEVSPLHGDFAGLPPMLVLCGTRDLLVAQVREAVRRAAAADVEVTYREQPGLLHVYPLLPVPEARPALAEITAFLT